MGFNVESEPKWFACLFKKWPFNNFLSHPCFCFRRENFEKWDHLMAAFKPKLKCFYIYLFLIIELQLDTQLERMMLFCYNGINKLDALNFFIEQKKASSFAEMA